MNENDVIHGHYDPIKLRKQLPATNPVARLPALLANSGIHETETNDRMGCNILILTINGKTNNMINQSLFGYRDLYC